MKDERQVDRLGISENTELKIYFGFKFWGNWPKLKFEKGIENLKTPNTEKGMGNLEADKTKAYKAYKFI